MFKNIAVVFINVVNNCIFHCFDRVCEPIYNMYIYMFYFLPFFFVLRSNALVYNLVGLI